MDAPDLGEEAHVRALEALARVNLLSGTAGRYWRRIRMEDSVAPLRLLDVACGGGDVALSLERRASRAGISLEVAGCDASPGALAYARARARSEGLKARFFQRDVTTQGLPEGFDVMVSSLFFHHLEEGAALALLAEMGRKARVVLVQDLVRSRAGYWLAWGTLRAISGSRVARVDGPRSVQAAFRIPEVRRLARAAGLSGARVKACWPRRFFLSWRAP